MTQSQKLPLQIRFLLGLAGRAVRLVLESVFMQLSWSVVWQHTLPTRFSSRRTANRFSYRKSDAVCLKEEVSYKQDTESTLVISCPRARALQLEQAFKVYISDCHFCGRLLLELSPPMVKHGSVIYNLLGGQ